MASLIVRNLDTDILDRLRRRAAAHGRSAEAEHRAILEQALAPYRTGLELWEAMRRNAPTGAGLDLSGIDQSIDVPDFR